MLIVYVLVSSVVAESHAASSGPDQNTDGSNSSEEAAVSQEDPSNDAPRLAITPPSG